MSEDTSIPSIPSGLVDEPNNAADLTPREREVEFIRMVTQDLATTNGDVPTQKEIEAAVELAREMGFTDGQVGTIRTMLGMPPAQLREFADAMLEQLAAGELPKPLDTILTAPELVTLEICRALGLDKPVPYDQALVLISTDRADSRLAQARAERLASRLNDAEAIIARALLLARAVLKNFDLAVDKASPPLRRDGWEQASSVKRKPVTSIEIPVSVVELAQAFADEVTA